MSFMNFAKTSAIFSCNHFFFLSVFDYTYTRYWSFQTGVWFSGPLVFCGYSIVKLHPINSKFQISYFIKIGIERGKITEYHKNLFNFSSHGACVSYVLWIYEFLVTAKPGHTIACISQTQTWNSLDLVDQMGLFSITTSQTHNKDIRSQRLEMKACNVQAEAFGPKCGSSPGKLRSLMAMMLLWSFLSGFYKMIVHVRVRKF